MIRKTLVAALALLVPTIAGAADGDECTSAQKSSLQTSGNTRITWCYQLCDADTGNVDCSAFDMNTVGFPDIISFLLYDVGATCTSGTATLGTTVDTGVSDIDDTNVFALGSTTALVYGGTTRINVDLSAAPLSRYVVTEMSNMSCTTGLDVLMVGYEVKR